MAKQEEWMEKFQLKNIHKSFFFTEKQVSSKENLINKKNQLNLYLKTISLSETKIKLINLKYKIYNIYNNKNKKKRTIEEPSSYLMNIQRSLLPFFEQYPLLNSCMARKGLGIKDNAIIHANAKYLLQVDINNCYSSITIDHIRHGISYADNPTWIYIANQIIRLSTFSKDKLVLPTGAPTSPILCNIALTPLDIKIQELADKYGYSYTRYIDDLCLSTTSDNRRWSLIKEIEQLIIDYNLRINKGKTKWYTVNDNDNVIITGVRIKQGYSVPRHFIRLVRARLQNLAKNKSKIDPETLGCLSYISSIDIKKHNSLLKYYDRRLRYVSTQRKCINSK